MLVILNNLPHLARFREFLVAERLRSLPTLTYYSECSQGTKSNSVCQFVSSALGGCNYYRHRDGQGTCGLWDPLQIPHLKLACSTRWMLSRQRSCLHLSRPRASKLLARLWKNAYEERSRISFEARPMRWHRCLFDRPSRRITPSFLRLKVSNCIFSQLVDSGISEADDPCSEFHRATQYGIDSC